MDPQGFDPFASDTDLDPYMVETVGAAEWSAVDLLKAREASLVAVVEARHAAYAELWAEAMRAALSFSSERRSS